MFEIKAFKDWSTHDGGGYQFNLYYNKKKFAFVHNDGNGGSIEMDFYDKAVFPPIWDNHVKSLGQWKSDFGAINGTEFFDHDDDTAIGILVEDYEMSKMRKKGTVFRLKTDKEHMGYRILNVKDVDVATKWLADKFGANQFEIV